MRTQALVAAVLALAAAIVAGLLVSYYVAMPGAPGGAAGAGTLAILLTDPPRVPQGVTAIYLSYNTIGVHFAQAGNESGWVNISARGTVNLMELVNISTTIASLNITGKLNLLRFNISSVLVTYGGRNFTCYVPSGELTAPIIGGVEVRAGGTSAVILDLEPTVFNLGSAENPIFVLKPSAKAFPVPPDQAVPDMAKHGFRLRLSDREWWTRLQERFAARLTITSATLTNDSLSVTVRNEGNVSITLRLLAIWPIPGVAQQGQAGERLAPFFRSSLFVIEQNGSLVPLQFGCPPAIVNRSQLERCLIFEGSSLGLRGLLERSGYELAAHSSATLSYSGPIALGFGLQGCRLVQVEKGHWQLVCDLKASLVQPGAQYLIAVIGEGAAAFYVVRAS